MARAALRRKEGASLDEPVGPIVFRMLVATICASMLLSGRLLWTIGINYLTADASMLEKVHLSTYMIVITFTVWVIQSGGDKNRAIDLKKVSLCIYYLICTVAVLVYAISFLDGQLALIADSFMCPPLYMMMMRFLTIRQKNIILALILALMGINLLIIFYEFASGGTFLPPVFNDFVDQKMVKSSASAEFEGRASGLWGHPLSAGMVTLIFIVAAIETIDRFRYKIATLVLLAAAIASFPTFGSRWSILLFVLYSGFVLVRFFLNVAKSHRVSQQSIVILLVIGLAAAPMGYAAFQLGFFDRLIDRIENDNGSAASRMAAWDLFISSDTSDILLGDTQNMLTHKLIVRETTYGVEVFWLGFVMRYGLICALLYFPALLALMYQLRKDGGQMGTMVGLAFLAAISGSLSILGKTQLFSQIVIITYAMMPLGYGAFVRTGARQIKQKAQNARIVAARRFAKGPRWSESPAAQ